MYWFMTFIMAKRQKKAMNDLSFVVITTDSLPLIQQVISAYPRTCAPASIVSIAFRFCPILRSPSSSSHDQRSCTKFTVNENI